MWTITSSIITAGPNLFTSRLRVSVDSAYPFVYGNGDFLQVASLPDMLILPIVTGNLHRESSVDLLFRNKKFADDMLALILEDLALLQDILEVSYNSSSSVSSESSGGSSVSSDSSDSSISSQT